MTQISLNGHFTASTWIPETMINFPYQNIYFLQRLIAGSKDNKRQLITLLKRRNIFFIYQTSFRSNQTSGKNHIGHGVGDISGNLPDAVQDIADVYELTAAEADALRELVPDVIKAEGALYLTLEVVR